MNTSRRKSILILIATLFFGVLLGLLVPAVVHKINERKVTVSRRAYGDGHHRRMRFAGTLEHVISPDSEQRERMRPVVEWAGTRIDSIESSANRQVEMVLDSLSENLAPILTEEQRERLEAFHDRARNNWRRHDGHRDR